MHKAIGFVTEGTFLLSLLGLIWCFLFLFDSGFLLKHFQERDILRAQELLAGKWQYLGPETNASPRLPGPFYYFLLSIPIAVTGHWQSTAFFLALMFGAAITFLTISVRKISGLVPAVVCSVAISLNPLITHEVHKNWNPSFSICWMLIILGVAIRLPAANSKNWLWVLVGILISSGIQMHGSFAVLYLAVAWILFDKPVEGMSRKQCSIGFVIGATIPLIPFMIALLSNEAGLMTGEGSSGVLIANYLYRLLSQNGDTSFFYRISILLGPPLLIQFLASTFGTEEIDTYQGRRAKRVLTAFAIVQAPGAFLFLWGGYGERYATPFLTCLLARLSMNLARKFDTPVRCVLLLVYGIFLIRLEKIVGLFFSGAGSGDALGACVALALVPVVSFLTFRTENRKSAQIATAVSLVLACLPSLIGQVYLKKRSPTIDQISEITQLIRHRTGWSYLDFRWRTLAIGIRSDTGFQLPYEDAIRKNPVISASNADGLILAFTDGEPVGLQRLLQKVQVRIEGDYSFADMRRDYTEAVCTHDLRMCAYLYRAELGRSPGFSHNLGITYLKEDVPFSKEVRDIQGTGTTVFNPRDGLVIFSWNNCGEVKINCRTAIVVESVPDSEPARFSVTIVGDVLSRPDRDISPLWVEEWHQPFLSVGCRGKDESYELISKLGLASSGKVKENLAPFQRQIISNCPTRLVRMLSAGWKSSAVYRFKKPIPEKLLGPSTLSWRP